MSIFAIIALSMAAPLTAEAPVPATVKTAKVTQWVQASVTIVAAEPVDTRTPPARGSAQASTRQYRERDKVPLVEFF